MATIRPAIPNERKLLEALQREASLAQTDYRELLLAHSDAIGLAADLIAAGWVHVAEIDGAVGGFFALVPREAGEFELDGLFVTPSLWRQGIGTVLVDSACELARRHGGVELIVTANPAAMSFYSALGFEQSRQIKTRFGSAQQMRLIL